MLLSPKATPGEASLDCPTLEAFAMEERVLCPERPEATVRYEATIAGCRNQDSRVEGEF